MTPGNADTMQHAVASGTPWGGLTLTLRDGRRAHLAIIDDAGQVIESGRSVEAAVWHTVLHVHMDFLFETGKVEIFTTPPGLTLAAQPPKKSA